MLEIDHNDKFTEISPKTDKPREIELYVRKAEGCPLKQNGQYYRSFCL